MCDEEGDEVYCVDPHWLRVHRPACLAVRQKILIPAVENCPRRLTTRTMAMASRGTKLTMMVTVRRAMTTMTTTMAMTMMMTMTMVKATARWEAARRDTTTTTMATGDDDDEDDDDDGDGVTGNEVDDGDGATKG